MLTLISPAKKLANETPSIKTTHPKFQANAWELIKLLRTKSPHEIANLMGLSDKLSLLNFDRYQQFQQIPDNNTHACAYLFQGDVYQTLDFKSLEECTVNYSQQHLAILSGLYGVLSPCDAIYPYRLEMGTKLANNKGNTLYDFWRHTITTHLNDRLKSHRNPLLINLASNEYFKAVDTKALSTPVIHIDFKELKQGMYKTIGIHAKRARGAMARYILTKQIDDYTSLQDFNDLGYQFNQGLSSEEHLVFTRD